VGKPHNFSKSQSLYRGKGDPTIFPSLRVYIEGRPQNFTKSQNLYIGQSPEFFQVPRPIRKASLEFFQVADRGLGSTHGFSSSMATHVKNKDHVSCFPHLPKVFLSKSLKFFQVFEYRARTRDSYAQGSHAIYSATEVCPWGRKGREREVLIYLQPI